MSSSTPSSSKSSQIPTTILPSTSWMVEQNEEAQAQEQADFAAAVTNQFIGESVIINLTNEDGEKSECGSFQYAEIHRTSPNLASNENSFRRKFSSRGDLSVTLPISRKGSSMRHRFSDIEKWDLSSRKLTPTLLKVPRKGSKRSFSSARIDLLAVRRPKPSFNIVSANIQNEFGICGWILTILSYIVIFFTMPFSLCMSIKVVQEYERAVIFRLGRLLPGGAKGPGIFFIVPCIDTYRKVDLRVLSFEVPPQEILSKDSVTVAVDAVVYFRISNATISVTNVEDCSRSTKLLAQTTLRNILGTKTLAEMLSDREAISLQMQSTLDEATEPWGVKVERVEVKDVRLPVQLQRAMAAEAEAAREARAKVIVAEGEQKASRALKEAAEVIAESPSALQLRYLQTLNSISAEKNSTIIFPFPIDLLSSFLHRPAPKVHNCEQPGPSTSMKPHAH
uniref:Band 7 domain-containing protein n=1 Tax=Panagrolaimus sp. PS1159 TaxID=55785 RepID=A0AC35G0E0_9BILA